jgi:hypothetical protein
VKCGEVLKSEGKQYVVLCIVYVGDMKGTFPISWILHFFSLKEDSKTEYDSVI